MRSGETGPAEALVTAHGLSLGYGGPPVLTGVEFEVAPGTRIGLLGPNGGGKTTLFRALLGELKPASGSLDVATTTATVPQTDRSRLDYPVSCLDVAAMGSLAALPWWRRPGRKERARAAESLSMVGLADRAQETFGDMSGGQRQRALIARALTADAKLLLLDEPYTGLDSASAELLDRLIDRLAGEGRSVLIATHDVEQAGAWDLVLCLNGRQVAFGPPASTLDRGTLEATYGGHIVEIPGGNGHGVLPPHHHDHDEDSESAH